LAGLALLMAGPSYLQWLASGGKIDLLQVTSYFQILTFMMIVTLVGDWRNRVTMLTGSVLRVARVFAWEVIPLAAAEVKPLKTGWSIRWNAGRAVRRLSLVTPREFQEAVFRAAEQARAAAPGEAPHTVEEAMLAAPVAERTAIWGRVAGFLGAIAVLPLLSMWLNHPGFLLGLPVLFFFQDRIFAGTTVVLSDRTLWFLGARGPVYQIPLERVRSVEPVGGTRVLLRVDDPRYPVLTLNRRLQEVDMLRQLRKALAGEPLFAPAADSAGPASTAQAAAAVQEEHGGRPRCSLCGRSAPGDPEAGGIYICDRCQNRTRFEAQEAGHGLQGKEPLPM